MMNAYNELYLNDGKRLLANAFDYALNTCKLDPVFFTKVFVESNLTKMLEKGNPSVISGKSGEEFVIEIISEVDKEFIVIEPKMYKKRSPEYWLGWALAQYQWKTSKRYKDIFNVISYDELISMYNVFHEMDVAQFCEVLDEKLNNVTKTNLRRQREHKGLSQSELANKSGVSLRSVQLYEQKINEIDKAQAHTVFKLAKVLDCEIETILENPSNIKKL